MISGPVLAGHLAAGASAFLGRYHSQVCVLKEPDRSLPPGLFRRLRARASATSLFGTRTRDDRAWEFAPAHRGRPTALVPVDGYERVMPLDILPVPLLRSLLVGDTDTASALGCLELDEEDLALLAFLCPGKQDYGPLLRTALETIEREGP